MRKKITFLVFITLILSVSAIFAGVQQDAAGSVEDSGAEETAAGGSVTVTDFLGREITVETPVKSVVFTHYSTAEAVKVLDAWDLVVGRDGYTGDKLLYPNIDELPPLGELMGSPYTPNMELLLELDPDLLVLEIIPMPGIEELLSQLEGIVPVVTVKTYDPQEMAGSFEILGKLLGREKQAEAFTSWCLDLQQRMLDKTENMPDSEKTTMFYKTGYGSVGELMTFSNDMSYVPARNRITGCINVAGDLPSQGGWVPQIDPEWLARQDFEVLVIGDPQPGGYGALLEDTSPLAEFRKQVMTLPVFAEKTAVKTGRVYMLADEFFGTPRFIIGFTYLAKWFHPDLFEDMNPAELHQEYFDKFLRTDADVISKGVFVYPEE